MSKQVIWTKNTVCDFKELANLNEYEQSLLDLHAQGETAVSISFKLHVSTSKVYKDVRTLKSKYDAVCHLSEHMPNRVPTAKELYK